MFHTHHEINLPIVVLPTCLPFMPCNAMLDAMALPTSLASEPRRSRDMYLSGFAVFGYAPAEIGDAFVYGFCGEVVIAEGH
jgi:hypothetical protein